MVCATFGLWGGPEGHCGPQYTTRDERLAVREGVRTSWKPRCEQITTLVAWRGGGRRKGGRRTQEDDAWGMEMEVGQEEEREGGWSRRCGGVGWPRS
eukprot:796194-Pyramimonas_sp.AAC.1